MQRPPAGAPTTEDLWERIQPALSHVGVTRVADITWLDEVGIPCWQAIRPNSRTLSVSQGKGLTPPHARLSAAMEAIEVWHAENVAPADLVAPVGTVAAKLGYPLTALRLQPRSCLNRTTSLEWTVAERLLDGSPTLLPTGSLRLSSVAEPVWEVALFDVTSNGLASGATREDAILHGLYEVVERDAMARTARSPRPVVALDSLPPVAGALVRRFLDARIGVTVERADSPLDVPCFVASASSDDYPARFLGSGAHRDPAVALCRALTEAAQSRVAAIAGTREDLSPSLYYTAPSAYPVAAAAPTVDYRPATRPPDPPTVEIGRLAGRIAEFTGYPPLVVDHTRADVGVPVVRVVCPGLRCPEDY
jgi:ribosomal protein S12 methylthiotransferase accessory factor